MKRVMIFGTFDLFHIGHLKMIKQAAKLGDELMAVIARDTTVDSLDDKGSMVHSEKQRQEIIGSIEQVDKAVLGNKDDVYKVIKENRPDVIALGYDQTHFVDKLEDKLDEFNLDTEIVRLQPYKQEKFKSSKIKDKIAK